MHTCVYCTDYLGRDHKKTVDSGYIWRMTRGLGIKWEWNIYTVNLFYHVRLGEKTVENNRFLKNLKPLQ